MADKRHATSAVGANFKALRRSLSWTQQALARRSGVSRDTIHRLEKGGVIELDSLAALLDAMGQQIAFVPKPGIRAEDMRRRFAHIHEDAE